MPGTRVTPSRAAPRPGGARLQLIGLDVRLLQNELRDQLVFRERRVHLRLHFGFVEVGLDLRSRRLRLQQVVLQLDLQVLEARQGSRQFQLGILQLLFELRVRQFQNHVARFHCGPWSENDLLDPALRGCRNPSDVFRRQRAQPPDLANHWTPFDRIRPDYGPFDGRRRRFQPGQRDADEHHHQQADRCVDRLPDPLFPDIGRSSYIHGCVLEARN